jgi:hypothetical protein
MSDTRVELADLIASGLHAVGEKVEDEIKASEAAQNATVAWSLVKSEAASHLKDALSGDALEVIAAAWSKAKELKKYADPAKYPPDQSVVVHLGEHKVSCQVHPAIEISFNDVPVRTVKFTLEFVAKFKSAALTIRGGVIRAVAPGACSAQAVLKYGNVKLKEEQTPEVRFPGRLDLGNGLRIA